MQAILQDINLLERAEQTTARLKALAAQHSILLTDENWNEIVNWLDRFHPLWRGYPVPQTTGNQWRAAKGEEVEVIG